MKMPLLLDDPQTSATVLTALASFIGWASMYGHELREGPIDKNSSGVSLELSASLSASFNFGYQAGDQTVYVAVEPEEFEWLPQLPISEVLVGLEKLYVMTNAVIIDGEKIDAMAIGILIGQPKLWRAFPDATTIGFMCIRSAIEGYAVTDIASERYPLRYMNS